MTRKLQPKQMSLTKIIIELEELKIKLNQHKKIPEAVLILQKEYHNNLNILRDYQLTWTLKPYEQWYEDYLVKNSPYKTLIEGNTIHKAKK